MSSNLLFLHSPEDFFSHEEEVVEKINYRFKNKSLCLQAFTHSSFLNEWAPSKTGEPSLLCNERLEFLGDSVLGFLVSTFLFKEFEGASEGELTHMRSRSVDTKSCSHYLSLLGLKPYLLMSKGLRINITPQSHSIWANLFEALLGAIYLDSDIETTSEFFFTHFKNEVLNLSKNSEKNWKAELQDLCQKVYRTTPNYQTLSTEGPEHTKIFTVGVSIKDQLLGKGTGSTKKEAQQASAKEAIRQLKET